MGTAEAIGAMIKWNVVFKRLMTLMDQPGEGYFSGSRFIRALQEFNEALPNYGQYIQERGKEGKSTTSWSTAMPLQFQEQASCEFRDCLSDSFSFWISRNRRAGLNCVVGPITYETGKGIGSQPGVSFYWHPQNLPECAVNLGRSATALWRVLSHSGISLVTDVGRGLRESRRCGKCCGGAAI